MIYVFEKESVLLMVEIFSVIPQKVSTHLE